MNIIDEKIKDMENKALKDLENQIEAMNLSPMEKMILLKKIKERFMDPDSALQLSYCAPNPTENRARTPHFIKLKPESFKLSMYPIKSPKRMLNFLQKMDQIKDPNSKEAKEIKTVFAVVGEEGKPLTAEQEAVYNSVQLIRVKVNRNHYRGIDALLILYAYLYNFSKVFTNIKLLQFMKQLELIMIRLNAYDASLCLGIEAIQLQSMQNISGVFSLIKEFIFEYNSSQAMKKAMEQRQQLAVQQTSAFETPATFNGRTTNTKGVYAIELVKPTLEEKSTKSNNTQELNAVTELNLLDFTAPQTIVEKIETVINGVIVNGLALIKQARESGNQINYNCYTNAFGFHALESVGVELLDLVRPIIQKYVKDDPADLETLQPKIIVMEDLVKINYLVRFSKSKPLPGGQTLLPGEQMEITQSSSDSRTSVRDSSRSMVDSQSDKTTQEFNEDINKEDLSSGSNSTDTSEYKDKALGVNVTVDLVPMISGGVNYDSSNGNSTTGNETRTNALNVISNTTKKNLGEKATKRDVTVSESTKEQIEQTNKNGIQRKIFNPNPSKSLQFIFQQMNEHYLSVTYSRDFKLIVTNGVDQETFLMADVDAMIKKYLQDDCPEIEKFKDILEEILTINDWQQRPVRIFPKGLTCGIESYLSLLKQQNISLNVNDLIQPSAIFEQSGVIIRIEEYAIPTNVMVLTTILGENALDKYKQAEIDAQNRTLIAQAEMVERENLWMKLQLEFIQTLTDPQQKLNAMFKLKRPDSELLRKTIFLKALDEPNLVKFFQGSNAGH